MEENEKAIYYLAFKVWIIFTIVMAMIAVSIYMLLYAIYG